MDAFWEAANSNDPSTVEEKGRMLVEHPGPTNPMVSPLLTDLYQFTMAYAYWKAGKHRDRAVFDLYFRKNPFGGEYTVFAGLEECIRLIANFELKEEEISFLRSVMPTCEDGFFDYLRALDCSDVDVYAISEGSTVFPKVPLMRVEGPVAVVQLLETPFLNLVNYASLVTTNAARHRFVVGKSKALLEFGLRRAQGPDGGISASRYCYMGGFDATSNVAAGRFFSIPLRGTHSHAFVSSFMSTDEIVDKSLRSHDGSSTCEDFVSAVRSWLKKLQLSDSLHGAFGETNQSELAAFISYALAMPNNFLALVDTYDTTHSRCSWVAYDCMSMVSSRQHYIRWRRVQGHSNVAAGRFFSIPLRGTHSHAFVSSFMSTDEIVDKSLRSHDGSSTCEDFVSAVRSWLKKLQLSDSLHGAFGETNQSELAAFISYALAMPNNFLALVDTYDVMRSGIPNFCAVALALRDMGYKATGIRLDSGDLAYLSIESRKYFRVIEKEFCAPGFGNLLITASNDLNEETIDALNKQGHEVDAFGIGTYLVTCYSQAALGCVFKLVEINGQPRIKLSEDVSKVTIPCKKRCYRLYGREGYALLDLMTGENEAPPKEGERILCRHPFSESKRAYVVPQRVEELLKCYWSGASCNKREELPSLKTMRDRCMLHLDQMRPDHMRRLNPTPYKVSVSAKLYDFIHFLWLNEAPVGELQ